MPSELTAGFQLTNISPRAYEHPADRAATSALRSVPMLDTVIRKLTEYQYERAFRQFSLANSVKIGPNQLPEIWESYLQVLHALDMPEQYDLYITQTPIANAFTLGSHAPMIVLHSGLITLLDEAEVRTVIAHEIGHILSEHSLYRTALMILYQLTRLTRSANVPFAGLPIMGMYLVLLEWFRAAELSADRAATLAVHDPLVFCRSMMNMAGGSASQNLNLDAFIQQASDYEEWDNKLDKSLRFFLEVGSTHPFAVRRVSEVMKWVRSGEYDRILRGEYRRRDEGAQNRQDVGDGVRFYSERFGNIIKDSSGSVGDFGRQARDWLRRNKDEKDDQADSDGGPDADDPNG